MKYNITYIIPVWGKEYLPSQYEFLRKNYGGEIVYLNEEGDNLKSEVKKLLKKGCINISFWADILTGGIYKLFNKLGIYQIFIEHGCCPKRWFTFPPRCEDRLRTLSEFSQLWPTSLMEEEEYKRAGKILKKKIKKIGYLKGLQYFLEPGETEKNQVYICPSYWADWGEMDLTVEILKHIDSQYKCYVSLHPSAYRHYYDELEKTFKEKDNIYLLKTSDEKVEKLKTSEIVIGGNGTPLTEGIFMKKKIILIKGDKITWEKISFRKYLPGDLQI